MAIIKGKNSITSLNVDGTFYPVFCAKSWQLNIEQEEVEVTNIGSGGEREFLPGMSEATITADGVMELDNSGGRISILYIIQQSIRRKVHTLKTSFTDDNGGVQILTYNAFYKGGSINRQIGHYNTSNVEFRVTGLITFSNVVPPPVDPVCEVQETLALTLLEGEISVSSALLEQDGAEVLWVSREGIIFKITNGTPYGREFAINYATGTISFDPSNPGNPGGEGIEVGWQIVG